MQVYAYTDKAIDKLNAYALSLPRQPRVPYDIVHAEVFVPLGFLPIKIVQFSRLDPANCSKHYHWAIFIPTSQVPGIGNYYELAEDLQPSYVKSTINTYNARRGLERGSHTVGFIDPLMMPFLEAHFALTSLQYTNRIWGSQNWVCDALMGLNNPRMFYIGAKLGPLVMQMALVAAAWEIGDVN